MTAPSLPVVVEDSRVRIGERFSVSFQRTLRIPDDGRRYPLPPGLGLLPVDSVAEHAARVPESWRREGGVFIPMYQREALWLGFDAAPWKPNAIKVGVGRVNAVTGAAWSPLLESSPQDYLVCPDQPWLDGIKTAPETIRQFVAVPLGRGHTIEGQLTGEEQFGGIQLLVYEPVPGRFPDVPPPAGEPGPARAYAAAPAAMGLGAGGTMIQKIYPDRYGIDAWDQSRFGSLTVHIVNSEEYRALTGRNPPPTPISAREYAEHGLPWFALYDEAAGDLPTDDRLASVRSVSDLAGTGVADESSIDVDERVVRKLGAPPASSSRTKP